MTTNVNDVADLAGRIRTEVGRVLFGLGRATELILAAVLGGRHVLLEGVPGLGKTLLAKTLAHVLGCEFRRIQFTPDLLPADVLGGYVFDSRDGSFRLRKGPIFTQIVLADEINRAPAKTQSALLEVMQERQVTIEGDTLPAPDPFLVFATQNPAEHEGVYPLPQAQLDRFAMRLILGYPAEAEERRIIAGCREATPVPEVVAGPESLRAARAEVEKVHVADAVVALILKLVTATRANEGVLLGASPRVGVDLMFLGRALALLRGRDHVVPEDVRDLFVPVTNHRIAVRPAAEIAGLTASRVARQAIHATEMF